MIVVAIVITKRRTVDYGDSAALTSIDVDKSDEPVASQTV